MEKNTKIRLVAATNNAHKADEFREVLTDFVIVSLKDEGITAEPEENGETFYENALIKAKAIYEVAKSPVLADDSGLRVFALDGEPGVRSARYAGDNADDTKNNAKLLKELEGKKDRRAEFVCCLVYFDGKNVVSAEGSVEGEILLRGVGEGGFGYDPLFYCPELGKTFGEATPCEKNSVSHRARALEKLRRKIC